MNLRPLTAILGLICTAGVACASGAQIQLVPQTSVSVADQRSTVTINTTVFTPSGGLVPDGTQVTFSASGGATLRDTVVTTVQGRARAVLVAPGVAGTSVVTATAPAYGAVSTTEIEFFSDRSLLDSAKEYIEVYAPGSMSYGPQTKVIMASAPDHGIHLRYREISIEADDLQLEVRTYEVRAKHAHVKMGKQEFETTDLYLKLNARKGYAYGHFSGPTVVGIKPFGPWFKAVVEPRDHFGFAGITSAGFHVPEANVVEDDVFTFKSLSEVESTVIQAKKAIAFPRKEVQFQDAVLTVGGAKAMKLALYRDSMGGSAGVTDQIVSVTDNHLSVNYPYYLTLKPGEMSLLRFRTGQSYGRGIGSTNRVSLDYELNWNKGDNMDGGFVFSGLARKDWNIQVRQYLRFKDDTTLYANLEVPAAKGLFGTTSLNRQFKGFGVSLGANANQTLHGPRFDNKQVALNVETDPIKTGKFPARLYWGMQASYNQSTNDITGTHSENGAGLEVRSQLLPQHLDKNSTFNMGVRVLRTFAGTQQPLVMTASASVTRSINRNANILLTYDYNNDGFNSRLVGMHSLNLNANLDVGKFHFSGYALRSLDADRLTYFFDSSYRFGARWSLMYSHTFSEFLGERSLEYYPTLAYDIGGRQIGLTWSNRTKRFGIQLLGASLN